MFTVSNFLFLFLENVHTTDSNFTTLYDGELKSMTIPFLTNDPNKSILGVPLSSGCPVVVLPCLEKGESRRVSQGDHGGQSLIDRSPFALNILVPKSLCLVPYTFTKTSTLRYSMICRVTTPTFVFLNNPLLTLISPLCTWFQYCHLLHLLPVFYAFISVALNRHLNYFIRFPLRLSSKNSTRLLFTSKVKKLYPFYCLMCPNVFSPLILKT